MLCIFFKLGCTNSKSNTVSVDTANMAHADTVKKIMAIKESNPGNIAIASFDEAHFNGLNDADKAALLKIMASGIGNPGSEMGCYGESRILFILESC